MYSGTMIDELVEMVARVEGNAREVRASETERDQAQFASRFIFEMADAQPMMAGVL